MTTQAHSKDTTQVASALNLLRDQILETIYESALTSNFNEADKEALKQEYNRLSNELESPTKQTLSTDPLACLPPEVWMEIIQETAEENGVNLSPTEVLLSLTPVSQQWSTTVLGTSRLDYGQTSRSAEVTQTHKLS